MSLESIPDRMFRAVILLMPFLALACTDSSSNVGLGLLGVDTLPNAQSVQPSEFSTSSFQDITGGAPRVLAGIVQDPLVGRIDAIGYVDFTGVLSATDTGTITEVELQLSRNYVYGDSLESITVDIYDLVSDWNPAGLQVDTVLEAGDLITTVDFAVNDTSVTVPLPASWLDANRSTLRDADFDSLFHGFKLVGTGGNAITGFRPVGSSLRLLMSEDTTLFALNRTFTGIKRSGTLTLPENTVLFQDGAGPAIKFNFDLTEFKEAPVNGAVITVHADTIESKLAPANFVRPLAKEFLLVAVPVDSTDAATFLAQTSLEETGVYEFASVDLTTFFERVFFGTETYSHLELRAPVPDNTLNAMLLHDVSADDLAPQVLIVVSQ